MRIARRQKLADATRHGDEGACIIWSRLDQQHARAWVFRETVGQDAARRSGANDDIVITLAHCSPVFSVGGVSARCRARHVRSEEHTSALQSLMRTSNAVFCLKKKNKKYKSKSNTR